MRKLPVLLLLAGRLAVWPQCRLDGDVPLPQRVVFVDPPGIGSTRPLTSTRGGRRGVCPLDRAHVPRAQIVATVARQGQRLSEERTR